MAIEKTTALVLRLVNFSETSQIATLFTRDLGKIKVMAKGSRRLKSSFDVALDHLSVCSIAVLRKPSAELDLLTEAALLERFAGLRQSLPALNCAYYVAEVLDGLTAIADPHRLLFDQSLSALSQLAQSPDEDRRAFILGWFALQLLREIGFEPVLKRCAICGGEPRWSRHMAWGLSTGGVLCSQCATQVPSRLIVPVQGASVRVMSHLQAGDLEGLSIRPGTREEIVRTLNASLSFHLGRSPRMAPLLGL